MPDSASNIKEDNSPASWLSEIDDEDMELPTFADPDISDDDDFFSDLPLENDSESQLKADNDADEEPASEPEGSENNDCPEDNRVRVDRPANKDVSGNVDSSENNEGIPGSQNPEEKIVANEKVDEEEEDSDEGTAGGLASFLNL
jgi:hypothetical protein